MPYTMRKVRNKSCYRVSKKVRPNKKTGKTVKRRIFSKCATRENAVKQMKLLRALENNPDFVPIAQQK